MKRFSCITFDGELNLVYDRRIGVNRLSAAGGLVNRWIHWGGRDAVLRCNEATYVDINFIPCMEEEVYARRLVLIAASNFDLDGAAPVTHSLE